MSEEFVCKQCGVCCLKSPCVFAQVNHNIHSSSESFCPELIYNAYGKYECMLIRTSQEAREVLLGNGCDDPSKKHLKPTFNCGEMVKEYFPNASEKEIDFILWNETHFPAFWRIPEDGWTASQCLRTELQRLKEKVGNAKV